MTEARKTTAQYLNGLAVAVLATAGGAYLGNHAPAAILLLAMPKSRIRVIDLETAGNGPYDVCEIGWQDVVLEERGSWQVNGDRGAFFVNPGRPITAETMAIHHILDRNVASAPLWKEIAPTVLRPDNGVVALAAHRAAFEQRYCKPQMTGGAAWICTWNAPCACGHTSQAFPTKCFGTSACRRGWFMGSVCRRIGPCRTPMSPPITCATC